MKKASHYLMCLVFSTLLVIPTFTSAGTPTLDQSYDGGGSTGYLQFAGTSPLFCQSFKPTKSIVANFIDVGLFGNINNQPMQITLRGNSNDTPGTTLASYTAIATTYYPSWQRFTGTAATVTVGNVYWLCMEYTGSSSYPDIQWLDGTNGYSNGRIMYSYDITHGFLSDGGDKDFYFKTYASDPEIGTTSPSTETPTPASSGTQSSNTSSTKNTNSTKPTVAQSPVTSTDGTFSITSLKKSDNSVETDLPATEKIVLTKNTKLLLSGKAAANAKVTIVVHSNPIALATQADKSGNWSYSLDPSALNIPTGDHSITAYSQNAQGKISNEVKVAEFSFIEPAQAASTNAGSTGESNKSSIITLQNAILTGALILLIIILAVIVKKRRTVKN